MTTPTASKLPCDPEPADHRKEAGLVPASKVRSKAKKRIATDRKRLREQDSPCADSCCPGNAPDIAASIPRYPPLSVPVSKDRP
jgi:hypothetical protein